MHSEFIKKLTDIVEANLANESYGTEELAKEAGISHSNLNRKLKIISNQNSSQFIRELRLKKAKDLLLNEDTTVAEIAYRVGFGSSTYFNNCFREYFGVAPGELRNRESETDPERIPEVNIPTKKVWKNMLAVIIIGLLIFMPVSYFLIQRVGFSGVVKDKSIAVLPFKNLSDDTNKQYFADGMMEEILNHLNQIGELRVISRTSVEQFRGNAIPAREIAKKLGVNFILEGSVLQYGGKVRIMIKLIDTKLDKYIFTEQYDREFSNIFQLQGEIAKQVSSALNVAISSKVIKRIEKIHTLNMEAYSYYLKGLFFLNRRISEDIEKSIGNFEKAIDADPYFAEAYSGMADAYYLYTIRKLYPRPQGYVKSKEFALKALQLDNNLAEAHATLGAILAWNEWKWEEAAKECKLAIELNQNSATAHQYYADILIVMRRSREAREQIDIALKLNPTLPAIYLLSANFYFAEGKCEEGLKECQKIIELNPPNFYSVYYAYFELYKCLGNELKAVESLQKAFSFVPGDVKYISKVKEAYDQSGMIGLLTCWIDQELEDPEWGIIGASQKYAIIGEKKKALDYLEEAFKMHEPGLPSINYDPRYNNIRNEPRFQALLDNMGLAPYQNVLVNTTVSRE
jgi:TolB-like protein/AraC-like DNA-binding protein